MSAKDKEPYEVMARKERHSQQDVKYTSLGISIAEVEREEKEIRQKEQLIKQDTQKTVQLLMQTKSEYLESRAQTAITK